MSPNSSILAVLSCLLLFSSAATAFNITKLLDRFPEFSTFNTLLNQTGLAKQINSRQTITVLAVENSAIGGLSGRPLDIVARLLSVHVILDYYDVAKLQHLSKKSSVVTTLYQASGVASTQQGFLNITDLKNNEVGFGSAIKGSGLDVKLVKMVAAQPYNLSVLQVSGVIVTPGIDSSLTPPPAQSPPPKKSPSPAPAPAKKSPTPSPSPADDEETADAPAAPETSPPAESPDDSPVSSPPVSADGPAADESPADDAPAPSKSSAISFAASGVFSGVVAALVSSFAGL